MPTAATFLFNATSRDAKGLFGIFSPFAIMYTLVMVQMLESTQMKHVQLRMTILIPRHFLLSLTKIWLDSDLTDDENKSGQVDEEVTRADYVSTNQKAAATWILKVYKCTVILNVVCRRTAWYHICSNYSPPGGHRECL